MIKSNGSWGVRVASAGSRAGAVFPPTREPSARYHYYNEPDRRRFLKALGLWLRAHVGNCRFRVLSVGDGFAELEIIYPTTWRQGIPLDALEKFGLKKEREAFSPHSGEGGA